MTRLADQQLALIQALFEWPPRGLVELESSATTADSTSGDAKNTPKNIANYIYLTGTRGLNSYQANGKELAHRALSAAYPVLAQLVGSESFEYLAHALWHAHPPERGDLAQWGDALPGFVAASDQLADVPYLPDVARVEWALHQCASGSDRAAQPHTFELLATTGANQLELLLSPGCAVVHSAWPVVSIVTAHQAATASSSKSIEPDALHLPDLSVASGRLQRGEGESALVWRYHFQPRVREAWPGEADFLLALQGGLSLGEAAQSAPALDFSAWLSWAVQTGLLLGVRSRAAEH